MLIQHVISPEHYPWGDAHQLDGVKSIITSSLPPFRTLTWARRAARVWLFETTGPERFTHFRTCCHVQRTFNLASILSGACVDVQFTILQTNVLKCWLVHVSRIEDNSISATAFKAIKAPRVLDEREENETEKGLRVADRGFLNTAVIRSEITHIDGEAGGKSYCHCKSSPV